MWLRFLTWPLLLLALLVLIVAGCAPAREPAPAPRAMPETFGIVPPSDPQPDSPPAPDGDEVIAWIDAEVRQAVGGSRH